MNKLEAHKKLLSYKKQVFQLNDLKKIFGLYNDNSLYQSIKRLKKDQVISNLINGKYYLNDNPPDEFIVANNLYYPSYISLETALNYYGILIQTPFDIISITTKKRKKINWQDKYFIYHHIDNNYFVDYIKEKEFVIATPEKALIDTIFLNSVGKLKTDFSELIYDVIDQKRLLKLKDKIKNKAFHKFFEHLKI